MGGEQLLLSQRAEPKIGGNSWIADVFVDPLGCLQHRILYNVGRVDTAPQFAIEAQFDHAAQAGAVALEQAHRSPGRRRFGQLG